MKTDRRVGAKLPRPGTPERRALAERLRARLPACSAEMLARELGVSRKTIRNMVDDGMPKRPREQIRDVADGPRCACGLRLFTERDRAAGSCGTCPSIDDYAGARRDCG